MSLRDEVMMTLLLYEGSRPSQIVAMRWKDVSEQTFLPRSRSLIDRYRSARRQPPEDEQFLFGSEDEARAALEQWWMQLRDRGQRARPRPRVHLPEWSRVPDADPMLG